MALLLGNPDPKAASLPVWQRFLRQVVTPWREFDSILLATVLALTGIGIIAIRSVVWERPISHYWLQQLVMAGIGLGFLEMVARIPYERLLRWHWLTYFLTLASLIAVLFLGTAAGGAERWISIAGFQLQPSEFAKLGVIITLAAILHHWPIRYFSQIWVAVAVIAPPWILIFLQPNLGTALVFVAILLVMLYWAGAKGSWILLLVSPAVGAILYGLHTRPGLSWMLWVWLIWCLGMVSLAAWRLPWRWSGALSFGVLNLLSGHLGQLAWHILKPYQRRRLEIFIDPMQEPWGSGYHLIQSRIAIGAGGLWGRGIQQGTQTQLDFIPEQHTDFIFSAIGEEMGFVGTLTVLLLFWILCARLIWIAQGAKDNFGSLITIGVLAMILFQAVVNIGMTIGLAPITGLPLPFLSYGRSALLTNFLAIGLVESVAMHRQRPSLFK